MTEGQRLNLEYRRWRILKEVCNAVDRKYLSDRLPYPYTDEAAKWWINLLLTYSIRRLICEIGSNSLRGLYKTLYSRIFAKKENKAHYYDAIVSFLLQMTSKDAIPSDTDFAQALKERNLYWKNALCKYLLVAVENQGNRIENQPGTKRNFWKEYR